MELAVLTHLSNMKKITHFLLATAFILTFGYNTKAQQYNEKSFEKVDSLAQNAQPRAALTLIENIYTYANKTENATLSVKAAIYRMLFQSYLEEDAIDTIAKNLRVDIAKAKQPQKSILQSILAEVYWNYYQQDQYKISQRTEVADNTNDDIKTWSLPQLNKAISQNYFLSIANAELLQKVKIEDINILTKGDKENRIYRPTLYDLLAQRAIATFSSPRYGFANNPADNLLLSKLWVNSEQFVRYPISADSTSFTLQALKVFQHLIGFHQKTGNLQALADVQLKCLKFIYEKSTEKQPDKFYDNLTQLAEQAKNTEIYADILYEQALLHRNKSLPTDTSGLNLIEAVKIATNAINAYPKSVGAQNAGNLIRQIKTKELTFQLKNQSLPGKAIPIHFSYKNIDTLTLGIYKTGVNIDQYRHYKNENEYKNYIDNKTPIRSWKVALPKTNDYQLHTFIDKIEGLPNGNYLITAISNADSTNAALGRYINLEVSNIMASYRKKGAYIEYKIVNATDGTPLKGAKIQEAKYSSSFETDLKRTLTNQNGFALTNPNRDSRYTLITYQNDTTLININTYFYERDDDDKKVILFTDRAIYRPGQTIYYKGILLTTGKDQNEVMPNESVMLSFKDVNGKEIEFKEPRTNEFGSFQGSFVIPNGKLNGMMRITTDYGRVAVQVEEYKRPTFEVVFDKADQKYKLNDSIKVSGKATSFSGYVISNAKLNYKIIRRSMPVFDNYRYTPAKTKQMATGNLNTTNNGKFEIVFKAESDNMNTNYTFDVQVTITSNNGETREAATSIVAGKKDLLITTQIPQRLLLDKNRDTLGYQITNLNNQPIKAAVKVEWLLLKSPERLTNNTFNAEKYSMDREEWGKTFPTEEYGGENDTNKWPIEKSIITKDITANQNGLAVFSLSEKDLPAGYYKVKIEAINQLNDTLAHTQTVRIYHSTPNTILEPSEWLVAQKTIVKPNEKAIFRIAGLRENSKVFYEVYYKDRIEKQDWLNVSPKQSVVEITAQPYYEDSFVVQFFMVNNGLVYTANRQISVNNPKKQLEIKFLSFRDKLQPGEKEQWKLKVSNKAGEKEMAEMVATLYDASLDNLKALNWQTYMDNRYNYEKYTWANNNRTKLTSNYLWYSSNYYYGMINRQYEQLNLFGFNYYGGYNYTYRNYVKILNQQKQKEEKLTELAKGTLIYGMVLGRNKQPVVGALVKNGLKNTTTDVNGIYSITAKQDDVLTFSHLGYNTELVSIGKTKRIDVTMAYDGNSLNEVVVTGYGAVQKKTLTGAVASIRGAASPSTEVLQGKVSGLNVSDKSIVVEDNTVYNFASMESYDPKTGIYMVNGKPVFRKPQLITRTNFNETAFFYPQLKTNEKGEIDIEFTIPQSLTKYKMMGFAHTKDLKTAYITNQLITQKQLAVSVNAPRFFREADTIWLSAAVNNLSGKALKGRVMLELKDALTGNIVQLSQTPVVQQLELADAGNQTIKWQLAIAPQLSAITYKVLAEAGQHTDGEEMTIPVLPNGILMTESMPLNVRGNSTKTFSFDKFLKSGSSNTLRTQSLTLEYTANPAWYAVQALPYLMEYPYECAEQTFSRFYANSFATGIVNSSPQIKQVFEQWQQAKNGGALLSNLEKNQELKTILLEETPWVRQANSETERKKRIATLFDLNRMTYELKDNFEKLQKMQLASGAFPWFAGMREDRYITQHIVMGIGQLQKAKLMDDKTYRNFKTLTNKAIIYLDNQLLKDYNSKTAKSSFDHLPLHYLLARSYFEQKNTDPNFNRALQYYLNKAATEWLSLDTYQQAQAALILVRNNRKTEALKIIALLKQTAQQKEELGMYWPANANGWWWYQNPIETQALLIEAFDEVANDQKAVEEMKIWLLKNKQTNDWKTTKATAAACYALLMKGDNLLQDNQPAEIKLGNADIAQFKQPNATAEAGTGYEKTTIAGSIAKPEMGKVEVKNNNKGIAWGALYWQYFEQLDKITPSATGIKIEKQLFLQSDTGKSVVLTALNAKNSLKVGDLVKVRIIIKADRSMEYLHLKDMRSAGLEPVNLISQYKYQDGLGYYESTKDAATNFFIGYMPKGTYVFEYALRVTHAGNFGNGITSMQSMYAPEFTTYSGGIRVKVE